MGQAVNQRHRCRCRVEKAYIVEHHADEQVQRHPAKPWLVKGVNNQHTACTLHSQENVSGRLESNLKIRSLFCSAHRNRLMMVDRISSGTYCARMDIMDGQKTPTHTSNMQNATSCTMPSNVMPAGSGACLCQQVCRSGLRGRPQWGQLVAQKITAPGASLLRLSVSTDWVR